ncbi:hypothetical protein JTE90_015288 [Oedothorax gibbosus]|uniref:Uncharacterized protein n=1 Tax=Oedothorax gibbosus TaxID=931172 RepID=A0AAV6VNY4_9ARAC|nr:hypothetical protein JTE90_015288 [Oedothorax gibbosus]
MCGQLMLGEVDSCKSFEHWVSRFYVSEYKIVIAIVFRLENWTSCVITSKNSKGVCLCFAAIFKPEELSFVLDNQEIIDFYLRKGVNVVHKNKVISNEAIQNMEDVVNELASLIFSLHKSKQENKQIAHPSLQDFLNLEMICRAIESHLKTSGCTVVLGSSDFTINQVVSVLSFFNGGGGNFTPSHTYASKSYILGIHIQGVIKDTNKECEHLIEQASKELFPLTVVDVDLGKVWQTIPLKQGDTYKNSVTFVEEKGHLVPELLKDLKFIQETDGDFKSLLKNFYDHLISKSAAMIKLIEQTKSICGVSLNTTELQSILNVTCMVDLQILFGCAERLKPGIRCSLA